MRERHGQTNPKTPTYHTWQDMRDRCYNKNNKRYFRYGGRGITVCAGWKNSFVNFLTDMGPKVQGMTIERKDNNKGYSVQNCKWATYGEQNRNHSRNRLVTLGGETRCLVDWCDEFKLKYNTILYRIIRGWSPEKALTTEIKSK